MKKGGLYHKKHLYMKRELELCSPLKINGSELKRVKDARYLGIILHGEKLL